MLLMSMGDQDDLLDGAQPIVSVNLGLGKFYDSDGTV